MAPYPFVAPTPSDLDPDLPNLYRQTLIDSAKIPLPHVDLVIFRQPQRTNNQPADTPAAGSIVDVSGAPEKKTPEFLRRFGYRGATYDELTECRRLFIGQIPPNQDQKELYFILHRYGTIEELVVLRDRNTASHIGAAFCTFSSKESAWKAVFDLDGILRLEGAKQHLVVRLSPRPRQSPTPEETSKPGKAVTKMYITNIPLTATIHDIHHVISAFDSTIGFVVFKPEPSGECYYAIISVQTTAVKPIMDALAGRNLFPTPEQAPLFLCEFWESATILQLSQGRAQAPQSGHKTQSVYGNNRLTHNPHRHHQQQQQRHASGPGRYHRTNQHRHEHQHPRNHLQHNSPPQHHKGALSGDAYVSKTHDDYHSYNHQHYHQPNTKLAQSQQHHQQYYDTSPTSFPLNSHYHDMPTPPYPQHLAIDTGLGYHPGLNEFAFSSPSHYHPQDQIGTVGPSRYTGCSTQHSSEHRLRAQTHVDATTNPDQVNMPGVQPSGGPPIHSTDQAGVLDPCLLQAQPFIPSHLRQRGHNYGQHYHHYPHQQQTPSAPDPMPPTQSNKPMDAHPQSLRYQHGSANRHNGSHRHHGNRHQHSTSSKPLRTTVKQSHIANITTNITSNPQAVLPQIAEAQAAAQQNFTGGADKIVLSSINTLNNMNNTTSMSKMNNLQLLSSRDYTVGPQQ